MSLELCFKRRSVASGSELSRQNKNIRKKNNAVNANFSQNGKICIAQTFLALIIIRYRITETLRTKLHILLPSGIESLFLKFPSLSFVGFTELF